MWPLVTYSNYFKIVSAVTFLDLQTRLTVDFNKKLAFLTVVRCNNVVGSVIMQCSISDYRNLCYYGLL